ncbi:MAG: glutathione S-transferase N-terminal domain-containing protein [Rhizobiales bacterium]|nr:glutathione S-transferase N-terminal domain-containing protein [Hyphomicrobiales bacterium]MBI3672183.1 glutathione S-transferase N-terminal domain-containing protein [Hyphomicrobiales bacterium]
MKLYGDTLSPFVRMALVTAHEVGLGARITQVGELVKPTEANPKLTALSPIGKVPVLETDHAHAVYDSRVIIEYLCHVAGNSTLIPDDGVKRFRVLTLQALGQGIAEAAVAYRYETAARPQGLQWTDWMNRTRLRINASLDELEAKWRACLADVNVGSIAVAVALSYLDFRLTDFAWRNGRPQLAAFHQRFSARDSMTKTVIGKP